MRSSRESAFAASRPCPTARQFWPPAASSASPKPASDFPADSPLQHNCRPAPPCQRKLPAPEFAHILQFDEVQDVHIQVLEDLVGRIHREQPRSLQHVMHVGLGHAGGAGQATIGHISAANTLTKVRDQPLLQFVKGHFEMKSIVNSGYLQEK